LTVAERSICPHFVEWGIPKNIPVMATVEELVVDASAIKTNITNMLRTTGKYLSNCVMLNIKRGLVLKYIVNKHSGNNVLSQNEIT